MLKLKNILTQISPIDIESGDYTVIIADGEFPKNSFLHHIIAKAQYIICCDGAIKKLEQHQFTPNYIIGDCDSLGDELATKYATKIIKNGDQNSNDLTKAVQFAHELGLTKIMVLGATGMREDHAIANIALLGAYGAIIPVIVLLSDYGIFTAYHGGGAKLRLTTLPRQQISFFTLNPTTMINCQELKWPLTNYQFASWSSGSLNEATGNFISIVATGVVLIYRAFEIGSIK